MNKNFISLIGLVLLSLFCVVEVQAQVIYGTVVDKSGRKPIQGVSVNINLNKTGGLTDSIGNYSIENLPNGKLKISLQYTGYTSKDTLIQIQGMARMHLNFELESTAKELEEVVIVSSSRINSRIEDLPTKVEVLGSEEVHEENGIKPGNIASLLGDIAGIQIQQTSASTGNADMRIQGLQGKYTQILRDGMPLFGGYAGSFSILQIPPLDLQQIELVKGASSTLYGGGAIAGMLNLISKKPKLTAPEKSLTLNMSTLNEANVNSFFSGRNEKIGYTLYAGSTQQKEVDVDKDGFSDVPAVKSVFVHPRWFIYGKDKSSIVLGYTMSQEDRKGGDMSALQNGTTPSHSFLIQNISQRHTADIVYEKPIKGTGLLVGKANTSFFNRDIMTSVFGMKGQQKSWYSEISYSNKSLRHHWVAGINFNGEQFNKRGIDSSYISNTAFTTAGVFMQDDWKIASPLTIQSGLRIDQHNQYGSFVLPRFSIMYKLNNRLTMRMGAGKGYKTPSIFNSEMDERDYKYLLGMSKQIMSEKSTGTNFDINYKRRVNGWDLTFNQTFFYNQIQKPIILSLVYLNNNPLYNSIFLPVYQYKNASKSLETKGMETYVQGIKAPWELYAGYVYTDAKRNYDIDHPRLPLIAQHKFATVIAYEFDEDFRVGIESAFTGQQHLENGTETKSYWFAAAMIRYNIGKAAIVLNCENLLDERQNKNGSIVIPPYTNPRFPEIWKPIDGRVVNLSVYFKW